MSDKLLLGFWRFMIPIPRPVWRSEVSRTAKGAEAGLGFMSEEHHLVRDLVVRELPRVGESLTPEFIALELNLSLARVNVILEELESHMTFLFRDQEGAVIWAYPVTVEKTPHHVTFSTGEQIYAA
jgi:hypothetical protein